MSTPNSFDTNALVNQVAVVTGAAGGLGLSICEQLKQMGATVVMVDVSYGETPEESEQGIQVQCDIGNPDAVAKMGQFVQTRFGRCDVLVNNAGISQRSPAIDTDLSVYQRIVDVDLLAPIALTQALLGHLVSNGHGQIVMISSVAGKAGIPMRTAYCAAKHGLIGYADALRSEVAGQGVKVLVVAPGSVRTNVSRNALNADGTVRGTSDAAIDNGIDPDIVATTIWDAVDAGKREIVIAEGMEAGIPVLRAQDPEKLFDMVEAMVADGYAQKIAAR